MPWFQRSLQLPARPRGYHVITSDVVRAMPELAHIKTGLLHVFIQHTSASITINENADPDVCADLERALDRLAPENLSYIHTIEGPDDMPAHVKTALLDSSLLIPIGNGKLLLGTWQGIYLCEHRNQGGPRKLVLTTWGE